MSASLAPPGIPFKTYLTRLIGLSMLPLLLLSTWLAYDSVSAMRVAQDKEARHMAHNVANSVDQFLRSRVRGLNMLAVSPLVDDPKQWPALYQEALGYQQSFGNHVILASATEPMQMLFNTREPFGAALPPLPKPKGHAAAPAAVASLKPAVGDSFVGPVARELLVAIAVPVMRGRRVTQVVVSTSSARQLQERIEQFALQPAWAITLRDGRGDVIARAAPPGFDSARDVDPVDRFVERTGQAPWSVELEIPRGARQAPLLASGAALSAEVLLAALAGGLGAIAGSRRLGREVNSLIRPVATSTSSDIAEVRVVRGLLDEAAASQRESEAHFQRLFQDAPVAMRLARRDGTVLAQNTRFEQLFGYTLAEIPTIADWWQRAYPDKCYRAQVLTSWGTLRSRTDLNEGDIQIGEFRITCRDGNQRKVQIHRSMLADGQLSSFVDVTERRHAEDQIRHLNATLEKRVAERTAELSAANRELDSFAYTVSHDLRSPLRAMDGYSQLLVNEYSDRLDSEARNCLNQISLASHKMGGLIDGILTLSRSARDTLHLGSVDLSVLATRRLAELAEAEPERVVAGEVQPGLLVTADARMMDVVMTNLLDNAWKYSSKTAGARVGFYSLSDAEGTWYVVADNGTGFDPVHADQLFQPFHRLHRQDEFPGIGIGLATVQRIVERHGGRIVAESTPGQGATFRFTLPGKA